MDPDEGIVPRYHWQIFSLLRDLGFEVIPARSPTAILDSSLAVDYVFSLFNRAPFRGSEIFASSLCEYRGLPYLGARPHTRAVAEDKHLGKLLARHLGIATPSWLVTGSDWASALTARDLRPLKSPFFVKPRFGSASVGIDSRALCETLDETRRAVERLHALGYDALIEEFAPGRNITQTILGGTPPILLPPVEVVSTVEGNIHTYLQKRLLQGGSSRHVVEDSALSESIEPVSLKLYRAVEPVDYMRVDFRLTELGPVFLEFNVCCNLGSHATVASAARYVGFSHHELLALILLHSFRRQQIRLE